MFVRYLWTENNFSFLILDFINSFDRCGLFNIFRCNNCRFRANCFLNFCIFLKISISLNIWNFSLTNRIFLYFLRGTCCINSLILIHHLYQMLNSFHDLLYSPCKFLYLLIYYFLKLRNSIINGWLNFWYTSINSLIYNLFFLWTYFILIQKTVHKTKICNSVFS